MTASLFQLIGGFKNMSELIQNRETFLDNIAASLGRSRRTAGVTRPIYRYQPQYEVLKNASQTELLDVLKTQSKKIHVDFFETTNEGLSDKLNEVVNQYGGGPISLWNDERFSEYGLTPLLEQDWTNKQIDVHVWNPELGKENIERCNQANIGITFSDITLAESGTVVLFSSKDKGRSVSFLPNHYIAIIPKSTIVPRMTQAALQIRKKIQNGEVLPSCINFITGPSNSADIEMNLIVGVHGPVKAAYVIVNDR